jgi:hypothetical protein
MQSFSILLAGTFCWLVLPVPAADKTAEVTDQGQYVRIKIEVEIRGTLRHSSKGVFLETAEETFYLFDGDPKKDTSRKEASVWQLDLTKAKDLRKALGKLNGKSVIVTGTSELRKTVITKLASITQRGSYLPKKIYTSGEKWSPSRTVLVTSWKVVANK